MAISKRLYSLFSYVFLDKLFVRFPRVYYFICKVSNCVVKKRTDTIYLVPHQNCKSDHYDIFNTISDNVLVLFNSIISDQSLKELRITIVYYDQSKLKEYLEFSDLNCNGRVSFVYYEDYWQNLLAFFRSSLIFTDNYYLQYPYKTKKQKVVCLGYFAAPLKDDYYKILAMGKRLKQYRAIMENSYDYHISNSDYCSRLLSIDSLIPYERFLPLGMPRNDVFYKNNSTFRNKLLSIIGVDADKIFIYVPTHRDYENAKRSAFDKDHLVQRTIWGYEPDNEIEKLETLLEETNSIIIVKVHPDQARAVLKEQKQSRIFYYSNIVQQLTTSLNEMMSISDYMISDYTSAAYDFLCTDRPIIYYCYDIEKYNNSRGFFINPINPMCPGEMVYCLRELRDAMLKLLRGEDEYSDNRKFVKSLIIKHDDGFSAQRIKDWFFTKMM